MSKNKKTYLDFFLDNSEKEGPKVRGIYFSDVHEQAIIEFNDSGTTEKRKSELFNNTISKGFKGIVSGVMEMPKFHKLPKSMDREQLIEDCYYRLVETINKFDPNRIGKSGTFAKAFSWFSTIAKNFVLEKKMRHEKILKNKADVETSIDLSILSEDTLKMMSNYDKMDVHLESYETMFNNIKKIVLDTVVEILIKADQEKNKDEALIRVGQTLEYLLTHWNKIEFMKKNEFMRILTLYTGLNQQKVSTQFKIFKMAVFDKLQLGEIINSNISMKKMNIKEEDIDELELIEEEEMIEELPVNNLFKYGINTMEEFEMNMEYDNNLLIKKVRLNNKNEK